MLQGVLFDMDGVVLDTEKAARGLWMEAAGALGYSYTPQVFQMVLGRTEQASRDIYFSVFGPDFPVLALHQQVNDGLAELAKRGRLPFKKGFAECVDGLKARGLRVALATSTERAVVEVYRGLFPVFRDAFQAMVCGAEAPVGKPKPDIYLLAAQRLGLSPGACLGVEDSYYGLMSLRAAGAVSVMIPDLLPHCDAIAPYADFLLKDLTQLCPLIDRLNASQPSFPDEAR